MSSAARRRPAAEPSPTDPERERGPSGPLSRTLAGESERVCRRAQLFVRTTRAVCLLARKVITFAVFCGHAEQNICCGREDRYQVPWSHVPGTDPRTGPAGTRPSLRMRHFRRKRRLFGRARPGARAPRGAAFGHVGGTGPGTGPAGTRRLELQRRRTKRGLVAEAPLHAPHSPALSLAASTLSTPESGKRIVA
jgi:hypothetical protein